MDSNKRMAVNTVILYAKLIITIVVNLYSTRLILNAMGVEDYGVVNLISGIVAMLSFVQNSMSVSSQRYMSVNMGKHDDSLLVKVFNSSFVLHLILAAIILVVLESLTPVVFGSSIQIPEHRVAAAQILYQLTIIGTTIVVITVPYDAALNAHENMLLFSIATIIESLIRLAGAFILLVYSNDKLIFYGLLLITIRLVSMLIKWLYCRSHYIETRFSAKHSDRTMMKDMFAFAFWNMFGALAMTGRAQGVSIVMNTFFGVVINAAYGIAGQISGQLQNFTTTISKAMNPQIMQRAGAGDNQGMITLSLKQCKYASMLLSYAIIPLLFSMPYILEVWLKEVPDYCVAFCILTLFVSLFQQTTNGIMSLVQATGQIKNYQITISLIMLLNIPVAYIILKFGFSAPIVIVGKIVLEIVACIVRILFAKHLTGMEIKVFLKEVAIPITTIYSITCTILYFVKLYVFGVASLLSFVVLTLLSVILITITLFYTLTTKERQVIVGIINNKIKKY